MAARHFRFLLHQPRGRRMTERMAQPLLVSKIRLRQTSILSCSLTNLRQGTMVINLPKIAPTGVTRTSPCSRSQTIWRLTVMILGWACAHYLKVCRQRHECNLMMFFWFSDWNSYNPDTVDLTRDEDARTYWLNCFEESLGKFADRALESQQAHSSGE